MLTRTWSSMPKMLNRLPPYSGMSESTSEDARAKPDQLVREVAADEPDAAGDHHPAIAIEIAVAVDAGRGLGSHGCGGPGGAAWRAVGLRKRTAVVCRPRPRTTSCSHSFMTSIPVQNTRRKWKNCDRPWVRW